ncbi:hypothetical protein AB0882_09970 [Streptomyces sp. NPDC012485]|uniref:hypothetical protein n=1 Tax=unclassified Streptomyces TaxID=2593676 RepID=UPI003452CD1D|nr:hypothetical protein [Streptomyces pratensis]
MTIRPRVSTVAAAALTTMLLLAPPVATAHALSDPAKASAPTSAALELPRPTGPYAVGTEVLHLVDHSRTDPWVPAAGARELMVSLHHPARPGGAGAPASYMSTEEARLMLVQRGTGRRPLLRARPADRAPPCLEELPHDRPAQGRRRRAFHRRQRGGLHDARRLPRGRRDRHGRHLLRDIPVTGPGGPTPGNPEVVFHRP